MQGNEKVLNAHVFNVQRLCSYILLLVGQVQGNEEVLDIHWTSMYVSARSPRSHRGDFTLVSGWQMSQHERYHRGYNEGLCECDRW